MADCENHMSDAMHRNGSRDGGHGISSVPAEAATIERVGEHGITLRWADGVATELASIWLLDHRPEQRDPHSGQRLTDVTELPRSPHICAATIVGAALQVAWSEESHAASFPLRALRAAVGLRDSRPELQRRRWLDGAALAPRRDFAWQPYGALAADRALRLE